MPSAQPPILASSSEPSYSPIAASASTNTDERHDRSSSTPTINSSRQGGSGGDRDKPRLTEQEKKNNHIASEQKRRAAIREGFDRLTELVPGLEGQGRSESIVLRKTVDFIHLKIQERKELIAEIERRGGQPLLSTATDDLPPAYETATSIPKRNLPPPPPPLALPALISLRSKRVILASSSPRRRQIISYLGLPNIEIIPSDFAEDLPHTLQPIEYVLATAMKKAESVYAREVVNEEKGEPALILAADTIVVEIKSGAILEKPRSEAHHITMLKSLRDARDHKVFTALVAMAPLSSARDPGYAVETAIEETNVRFDSEITDDLILAYVRTREGVDKAGGYGMQGLGSILVESIDGSYDNVIGLPLKTTLKIIEKVMARADDDDRLPSGGEGDGEEDE
ncbi:Maf-like protein-domain-containing protein [Aspergillus granulosus]|uniref:Maf-like protein-domain-containing protein n=1 Tax=Aspergillus granulosus TaxID=176169 RepID=A0ABR4HSN8_9EURO